MDTRTGAPKLKIDPKVLAALRESKLTAAASDSKEEPVTKVAPVPKPVAVAAPVGVAKPAVTAAKPARKFRIAGDVAERLSKPVETKLDQLKRFYEGREKSTTLYTYTPDGNLVIRDESGTEKESIKLQHFQPLSHEEILQLNEKRKEEVQKYELPKEDEESKEEDLSYTTAVANLRDIYDRYKRNEAGYTARTVKDANLRVMEAEKRRNQALYPLKYINVVETPVINTVLLDSKDQRHFKHNVYVVGYYPFKKEDAFGHYLTPEEEATMAARSVMKGGSSIDVIVINSYEDPERGFLHPAFTKDFSYTSTQYSSVYQAYEVERLKMLKNQPLVDQLMRTRSPRTMVALASQDKTPIPNSYDLWFSVLKAFYQQNTDLSKKLVETGSSIFSVRDTTIPSPSDYMNALMSVRSMLAEGMEGGAAAPAEKHVITEEEQKKAKVGAIIYNRKFGGN